MDGSFSDTRVAIAVLIVAALILVLGVLSGWVKNRLWISEPLIAVATGILIGPAGFNLIDLLGSSLDVNGIVFVVTRVTLGIALMGAALRLPSGYMRAHWRELALILGVGMPLMWMASTLATWLWFPGSVLVAVLVGAIVTPTDPVLCASVLTGRMAYDRVPGRLRRVLTAESASNDGLGLLLVMLPVLLIQHGPGEALGDWVTRVLVHEIGVALVVGAAVGWVAGSFFQWGQHRFSAEPVPVVAAGVALSITVLVGVALLGGDAILAVFISGLVFRNFLNRRQDAYEEEAVDVVGRFFDLPAFVLFGMVLPWSAWAELGWVAIGFPLFVLLVRRLPIWLVLRPWFGSVNRLQEVLFTGWFGPVGMAAVFYATMAHRATGLESVWVLASLVAFVSVVIYGVSATPMTQNFGSPGAVD